MKIVSSSSTHVAPNQYDFIPSVEHKIRIVLVALFHAISRHNEILSLKKFLNKSAPQEFMCYITSLCMYHSRHLMNNDFD